MSKAYQSNRATGHSRKAMCWLRAGSWHAALVFSVVFALALGVTTRYSGYADVSSSTNKSIAHEGAQSLRQHMDRDAFVWQVPLPASLIAEFSSRYAPLLPTSPVVSHPFYDRELYNRPPPTAIHS